VTSSTCAAVLLLIAGAQGPRRTLSFRIGLNQSTFPPGDAAVRQPAFARLTCARGGCRSAIGPQCASHDAPVRLPGVAVRSRHRVPLIDELHQDLV
jgi:hypothetical protein